jgi:hypothetical protein
METVQELFGTLLLFLACLFYKHLMVDFFLQTPYQYLNKGKYFHPGGLLHSFLHIIATGILLFVFGAKKHLIEILIVEFLLHYHIDWAKVQINSRYGWKADKNEEFWMLLGIDQYLHALTYIGIVWWIIN